MADIDLTKPDALEDFERRRITLLGTTKLIFVAGTGPAVIVMTEMPGISPQLARFARWVRAAGFTVWMPNLFGVPGRPLSMGYALASMVKGCISAELRAFAANASSSEDRAHHEGTTITKRNGRTIVGRSGVA
jgi:hypothetical protein